MSRILVELDGSFSPRERLSDTAITDLIEAVIDGLDVQRAEPSVSTVHAGDSVDLTDTVVIEAGDELAAVRLAIALIENAFRRQLGLPAALRSVCVRSSALAPT